MRQATFSAPAQSSRGGDLGDQIRRSVEQAVSGAMGPVRTEMRARLDELRAERTALSDHLEKTQPARARRDLNRQVQELDVEIAKLEKGLNELDSRFSTPDGRATFSSTAPPSPLPPMDPMDSFNPAPMIISIMAILFIGFPLAVTFARIMWRRASGAAPPAAVTAETGRRFDRLEQSVDAIAIEIERISENQRYLTKVLSEPRQGASVGAGDK